MVDMEHTSEGVSEKCVKLDLKWNHDATGEEGKRVVTENLPGLLKPVDGEVNHQNELCLQEVPV